MAGIELVSNQQDKTPMGANNMAKLSAKVFESGAMVRIGGHNILLSPPLIITKGETDQILTALEDGLKTLTA